MRVEQAHVVESKEVVWHKRYGHLGVQSLKKLAVDGLVNGFSYDYSKQTSFCDSCTEGKHHRTPFPVRESSRAKEPLSLVHTDVCGKLPRSLGGTEYFVTFIDDCTRFVWVYFLKNKSDVFEKFLVWKAMVEKLSGLKLKVLRSDNGGEYTSGQFSDYLKAEGVVHQYTVPKTPEQNGVAERQNRTLIEMTRSTLAGSNLPQHLWAETLSTATYLRNRSPTKVVIGRTPYEGEKPDVSHLRVFGCVSYAHVPKDERKKLDVVTKRCVLVGYGSEVKGYHLFDPTRNKIFYIVVM